MNRIAVVCFALLVCVCDSYADEQVKVTLRCGVSFREIPRKKCFDGDRTTTINGVTYVYSIFRTGTGGLFASTARKR